MSLSNHRFEVELDENGHWIAEVPTVAGALAYGDTPLDAIQKACAIADEVIDRLCYGN